MKISSIMIIIAFVLLAAALVFQAMEMQSYSLFKLTYEKYMGKPSDKAAESAATAGKTDSPVNSENSKPAVDKNDSKPAESKTQPASEASGKTETSDQGKSSESSDSENN